MVAMLRTAATPSQIAQVMYEHDLMGLHEHDVPEDEYDVEARYVHAAIVALDFKKEELPRTLRSVFESMFSQADADAVPQERYEALAAAILELEPDHDSVR